VRAALLRKLAVLRLGIASLALGPQELVTVSGTVSDVRAPDGRRQAGEDSVFAPISRLYRTGPPDPVLLA
jgi:hypothetical protein